MSSTASACVSASRCINLNAGPGPLPESVLQRAQRDLLDYAGSGMGVMEMSHRSPQFEAILKQAQQTIRQLLSPHTTHPASSLFDVPADYDILFMAGGASLQFSAIPLNLITPNHTCAAYITTGAWSEAAAAEAAKFTRVHQLASSGPRYDHLPALPSPLSLPAGCAYVHYCHNETIHGVAYSHVPDLGDSDVPLVADFSSCFLSASIDVRRYALIYAGAQKNIGPSGVTVVIIKRTMLARSSAVSAAAATLSDACTAGSPARPIPLMCDYAVCASNGSMKNTPPTWNIYMVQLVLEWIAHHTLQQITQWNTAKAQLLYDTLDRYPHVYAVRVQQREARSMMNVVFSMRDHTLTSELLKEAEQPQWRIVGLAGHRSVGGLRASLYNAVTLEQTHTLVAFLTQFAHNHTKPTPDT